MLNLTVIFLVCGKQMSIKIKKICVKMMSKHIMCVSVYVVKRRFSSNIFSNGDISSDVDSKYNKIESLVRTPNRMDHNTNDIYMLVNGSVNESWCMANTNSTMMYMDMCNTNQNTFYPVKVFFFRVEKKITDLKRKKKCFSIRC